MKKKIIEMPKNAAVIEFTPENLAFMEELRRDKSIAEGREVTFDEIVNDVLGWLKEKEK